ncbi:MAG: hypothetical protein ACMUIP_09790 [bacterium]
MIKRERICRVFIFFILGLSVFNYAIKNSSAQLTPAEGLTFTNGWSSNFNSSPATFGSGNTWNYWPSSRYQYQLQALSWTTINYQNLLARYLVQNYVTGLYAPNLPILPLSFPLAPVSSVAPIVESVTYKVGELELTVEKDDSGDITDIYLSDSTIPLEGPNPISDLSLCEDEDCRTLGWVPNDTIIESHSSPGCYSYFYDGNYWMFCF